MMKNLMKKMMLFAMTAIIFCTCGMTANATQMESENPLGFDIAIYSYEIVEDATQENMPVGFTIGDWEYNGVAVQAGFTENSDMVCVMGKELETGNKYRFIYDPEHEMFVPYFGTAVKNGYVYTIPMYEGAEVPYGFMEAYFLIQTVPMFTYMREDAELTQEEIAVGSLSEDNYLVFLMMNENGEEVHYTYDLVDRTFQRSLLQKKDAEKVTELNETIDKLSEEIGILNANHAQRMNQRLTIIGVLIGAVVIMIGIIVNLILKVVKLKNGDDEEYDEDEDEDDEEDDDEEVTSKGFLGFFKKKDEEDEEDDEDYDEEDEEEEVVEEPVAAPKTVVMPKTPENDSEFDLEIIDLDLNDL